MMVQEEASSGLLCWENFVCEQALRGGWEQVQRCTYSGCQEQVVQ